MPVSVADRGTTPGPYAALRKPYVWRGKDAVQAAIDAEREATQGQGEEPARSPQTP